VAESQCVVVTFKEENWEYRDCLLVKFYAYIRDQFISKSQCKNISSCIYITWGE